MSNDWTGGRSGYEDVQSLPCDRDPMPRKNNQGGARPRQNGGNQQMKPKPGPRRNSAQTRTSRSAYDAAAFSGAPVASSGDLQQQVRFSSRRNGNVLVMNTCAPVAEVLRETTSTASLGLRTSVGVRGQALQLSPTAPSLLTQATKQAAGFVSPIWDLIGSAFVRYRVKRVAFTYEPQAAATDGERLVFAFAADPVHPLVWNTTPSTTNLLSVADSVAFMPWRAWHMDVTDRIASSGLLYTYSDPSTTVAEFNERFSDFGVIGLTGTTVSAGADVACGVLYMHTELEFEEFCPISVTRPASLYKTLIPKLARHAQVAHERLAKVKDESFTCM